MRGERAGVDPRPGDDDHPQLRDERLCPRKAVDHSREQIPADTRATNGDHTHQLIVAIVELAANCAAVSELRWVKAGDITREAEVPLRPVANHRQFRAESLRDDVLWVAHEER